MGKTQSKGSTASKDSPDHHHHKKGKASKGKPSKKLPVIEEVFVQKIAYKCGVTDDELNAKKETYLQHVEEDPTLGFDEFKCL